jgi:hypothetical protein
MSLLKCKFIRNGNFVAFYITEQSPKLSNVNYKAPNGMEVRVSDTPDIYRHAIYLRGSDESDDFKISRLELESESAAKKFINKAVNTLESMKRDLNCETRENLEINI